MDEEMAEVNRQLSRLCVTCGGLKKHPGNAINRWCMCCNQELFRHNDDSYPCTLCCWLAGLYSRFTSDHMKKINEVVALPNNDTPTDGPIKQVLPNQGL